MSLRTNQARHSTIRQPARMFEAEPERPLRISPGSAQHIHQPSGSGARAAVAANTIAFAHLPRRPGGYDQLGVPRCPETKSWLAASRSGTRKRESGIHEHALRLASPAQLGLGITGGFLMRRRTSAHPPDRKAT